MQIQLVDRLDGIAGGKAATGKTKAMSGMRGYDPRGML